MNKRLFQVFVMACIIANGSARAEDVSPLRTGAISMSLPGVHNAYRVTDNIYSGSQPEGETGFAALKGIGIKTIVSVDGSKPEPDLARKYGMRYIHLPIGYDGVPTNRIAELVKLSTAMDGPFFVHCHHGKHRGPAAAAVMCEGAGVWTPAQGVAWMRMAGTAEDYPGLYRAAREFQRPTSMQLAAVQDFPETARTSSLVDAMVAIDVHFDWLKRCQEADWKTPAGHPDISPRHEATMLWEQLRETARLSHAAERSADFRERLTAAIGAAEKLEKVLRKPAEITVIGASFNEVTRSCVSCHKLYRNE